MLNFDFFTYIFNERDYTPIDNKSNIFIHCLNILLYNKYIEA